MFLPFKFNKPKRKSTHGRVNLARILTFMVTTVLVITWMPVNGVTQPAGLQIGDRVRVIIPSSQTRSQKIVGHVTGLSPSWVEIKTGKSSRLISYDLMKSMYVSQGRKRNVRKGLIIGAGVGALTGGIIGAATYTECNSEELFGCFMQPASQEDAIVLGSTLGMIGGSITGALIGLIKSDKWERVPVDLSVGLVPNRFQPSSLHPGVSLTISLNPK